MSLWFRVVQEPSIASCHPDPDSVITFEWSTLDWASIEIRSTVSGLTYIGASFA